VSLISNIEYNDGGLRVWKACGIGPGKCIRLSELNTPQVLQVPDLVKCDGERMPNAHFIKVNHPICYDSYYICELIADSKLSKFVIQMLQNICEHFDIPTTYIKVKRKAPYIERLITFGKKCTCQGIL
ncbi:hypothetical protein pdam_00022179, partial [Pocillopora damicornis]